MKLAKVSAIGLLTTLSFSPSLRKASAEDSPPNGAAPVATGRDKSTIQSSSTANLPAWKRLSYREAENRPYLVHAAKAALEAERALAEFDKKHFPDGFQRYINQKENQRASLAVTERSVLLTRADARIQEILKTGRQKHHEAIFGDGGKDISLLDIASDAIDVATAFGPGKVGKLAIGIAGLKAAKFTKDHLIDEDAKVVRGALQHEYLQLPNDFREILDQFSKTYPGRNTPDRNKFWGEFDNIYRVSPNASDKEVFAQYPSIAKEAKNDQTAATVADLQQKVRLIQTQMKQLMLREGRDLSPIDLDQKLQSLKEERAKFVSRLRGELKNLEPELKEQLDKLQDSSTKHADVISAAMTGKLEDYLKNERLMDHRARVQEFRGYANGLATILGAIDPKAAPVVLQLAELGEAIADFAFSKLDPMMFTNVASAAMGLLSLLMSSGPSPEQMMLEKLDKLQESVDQMRQEMHDGFERIERILNGIGAQIIELQKQIQSLADQIASMDQKLDSLLRIVSMTYDSVKIIESASINEEKRKFEELLRHNQKKLDVVDPEEVKTAKKWLLDSLLARISQSGFVTGYYLVDDLKKEALLDKAILQLARRGVSEVPALAATLLSYDPKRDQLDSQDIFYQTVLILLNQNRSPLTLDETKQILDQAKKISRTASQWDKKANLVKALKIYQSQIDELFLSLSAECRLAAKDVNFSPPFHAGISPSQGLEQFRSLVFSYASPWQENISPLCVVNTEFVSEVLGKRKVDRNSHEAVLALSKFWNSISPDHTLRGGYSALHYEFTNASKPGGWEKTGDYLLDKDKADQQIYGIRFGWNFARLLPSYEASYQFAQLGEAEDYSGKKVRFKVASPEGYVRPVHLSVDDPREDKMISIGLPGTSGEGPNATVQRGNYYVRPVRAVPEFVAEFKSPITGNPIAQIQYRPNTKLYFYTLLDYKNYSPVLEEGIKEGQLPPRFWPKGGVFPKLYEDLKTQLQHWQTNITLREKKDAGQTPPNPSDEQDQLGNNGHRFHQIASEQWSPTSSTALSHRRDCDLLAQRATITLQSSEIFQTKYADSQLRPIAYEVAIKSATSGVVRVYDSGNPTAVAMELEFELPDGLSDGAKSIEADHTYRLRIAELVAEDQSEYKIFLEELNKKIMPFLQKRLAIDEIQKTAVYNSLIKLEGARRLVEGWINEFAYDRFTKNPKELGVLPDESFIGIASVLTALSTADEDRESFQSFEKLLRGAVNMQIDRWLEAIDKAYQSDQDVISGSAKLVRVIRLLEIHIERLSKGH